MAKKKDKTSTYTAFFQRDYMPLSAFYFSIKFNVLEEMDSSFQEVSGLKLTTTTDPKKLGGNNVVKCEPKKNGLV
ncbi:hypothetical protein [Algibacter mikhailovii]|uniref:hypothetical protein n=1 Tax=Algibacter mikhailovii TaxID=425498 RepID=UPI00249569CB|nr:hypothetical protein [Algibacter mikhailovii]